MTEENKKYSNYDPIILLASCFGAGLLPRAPGTFGSIFGMLIYFITLGLGKETQVALSVVFLLIGMWVCEKAAKKLDSSISSDGKNINAVVDRMNLAAKENDFKSISEIAEK